MYYFIGHETYDYEDQNQTTHETVAYLVFAGKQPLQQSFKQAKFPTLLNYLVNRGVEIWQENTNA